MIDQGTSVVKMSPYSRLVNPSVDFANSLLRM
jgi:hypothetical protein